MEIDNPPFMEDSWLLSRQQISNIVSQMNPSNPIYNNVKYILTNPFPSQEWLEEASLTIQTNYN